MVTPEEAYALIEKWLPYDGYDLILDLKKSKGQWLYDSRHKRKILDFFGFFASSPLGMNHPKMFEQDFLKRLKYASVNKVTNGDTYTVEMAEFVEAMASISPSSMKHMFFVEGGALAVENALKTAFDWKVRKNMSNGATEERGSKVIHLKEAFHGRTGYTLSMTNTSDPNKIKYYPKFDWPRVTNPKITFPLNDENLKKVKELEQKSLDEIQEAIYKYGNDIAAFIMEPIQAEGGDNHFREEYFKAVREITAKNDILFIVDEVQSGMGITGKWWAYQHFDFEPDIITFAKKSQCCGILANGKIDDVEDNVFHVPSRINSTWNGNITDMVRSTQMIKIMKEENLLENAEKSGRYLLKRLEELQSAYPLIFSNARGRGVMCAIDLKDKQMRDKYISELFKKKLLLLKCGERSVRFRPPLIVGKEEIDMAFEIMIKVATKMRP